MSAYDKRGAGGYKPSNPTTDKYRSGISGSSTSYDQPDIPLTPIPKKNPKSMNEGNQTTPLKKNSTPSKATTPNMKHRPPYYTDSPHNTSFNPKSSIPPSASTFQEHFAHDSNTVINALNAGKKQQTQFYKQSEKVYHDDNEDDDDDEQNEDDPEEEQNQTEIDNQDYDEPYDNDSYKNYTTSLENQIGYLQKTLNEERAKNKINSMSSQPSPPNLSRNSNGNGTKQHNYHQSMNSTHEDSLQFKKKIEELTNDIYKEKEYVLDREEQIIDIKQQLDQVIKENNRLIKENLSFKKSITQLNKKLDNTNEKELENNITIQNLNNDNKILYNSLEIRANEYSDLETNYHLLFEEKKKLEKKLKKDISDQTETISNLKISIDQKREYIDNLENKGKEQKENIELLEQQINQISSYTKKSQTFSSDLSSLNKEFNKLKSEFDISQSNLDASQKLIKDLSANKVQLEEREKDQQKNTNILKGQFNETSKKHINIITQLEQKNIELSEIINSLTKKNNLLNESHHRIVVEKKSNETEYKHKLSHYENQIKSLEQIQPNNNELEKVVSDLVLAQDTLKKFSPDLFSIILKNTSYDTTKLTTSPQFASSNPPPQNPLTSSSIPTSSARGGASSRGR